jgi:hypothetical protein
VSLMENQRFVKLQPNPFKTWKNKLFTQAIKFHCWLSVVSCAVPVGNVSWILFQEGQSSNFS